MIYTLRPLKSKDDIIIYLCSEKEVEDVLEEIERLDVNYISQDDGIIAYDDDPFLLTQINVN
jgi:hypothetical protein